MLALGLATISPPIMAQETGRSPLTLEQAVNQALQTSPVLAASGSRSNAASAAMSGAGALPNPEISIEAENIFGDGPYEGTDAGEVTYGISQLIELSGKRSGRVQIAEAEKKRMNYSYDSKRLDLIRDVSIAYAEIIAAERELTILTDEHELVTSVRDSVSAKVTAGKVPPIQKNKAEIELSASDIALDRMKRLLVAKQSALTTLMGETARDVQVSASSLPALAEPEALEVYKSRVFDGPDLQGLEADIEQARSQVSFEKANAIPDPTLAVGIRQFREDDNQAIVAGVSFPFPVFNLNRAGIERAGHEVSAARLEHQSAQLSIENQLVEVYGDLINGYRTVKALETTVLPGAEEAFSVAREGYNAGKFEYLEVLDAQRTLFEARKEHNSALLDYYRQKAILDRLTAKHSQAPEITQKDKK